MKRGKAHGKSRNTPDQLQSLQTELSPVLKKILTALWEEQREPQRYKYANVVNLFRKGAK